MHIGLDGVPAYPSRFERTFGFYEGRAAVDTGDGWLHITVEGQPLSDRRFSWCGNHQGGRCGVRHADGSYGHLDESGRDAYASRWRYAGDFRDGVAVVQRADGLHTHIDREGRELHGHWFVDLDVFHKGFARARDHVGWHHIDGEGMALYRRRFQQVEPFYNGQARVERFDGGLEVVDEGGCTKAELRPARRSDFAELSGDMVGFWRTEAIGAAVRLGFLADLPATTELLAARRGLVAERLDALLRALRELRLVEPSGGGWMLTAKGAYLLPDHPMTLAGAAIEYSGPLGALWSDVPRAMGPQWSAPDVFGDVAGDPNRQVTHHRMLRSYARHDYAAVARALPLDGDERVLDVGGGLGVLAEMLLDRHGELSVVLLDRPEVIAQVEARERLTLLPADLHGRWGVDAGAALLARVLHDWPDETAIEILRSVRGALPLGARVFVVEMLVERDGAFGGLCDLHLLMATGGRERTQEQYGALLHEAGFEVAEVLSLPALPSVLVGVAR